MSHQIKINLANESTNSPTLQPIIISWTNPSTDNQLQMIDEKRIKQENELQILSQVIQEIPHPAASKKVEDIVSPTRVLRSSRLKMNNSSNLVEAVQQKTKVSPKSGQNSKNSGGKNVKSSSSSKDVEIFTKKVDIHPSPTKDKKLSPKSIPKDQNSKKTASNTNSAPKPSTVNTKKTSKKTKGSFEEFELSSSTSDHPTPTLSKKLIKTLPKNDNSEKSNGTKEDHLTIPKRKYTKRNSKPANEIIEELVKEPQENTGKKDKNGNSIKIIKSPNETNQSKARINSFNEKYIKKEKELNIITEVDSDGEYTKDSTMNVQDLMSGEPSNLSVGTKRVKNLKNSEKFSKFAEKSQNEDKFTTFSTIKDEAVDEVTVKVINIRTKAEMKEEPIEHDDSSENWSCITQINSSPSKCSNTATNPSNKLDLGPEAQQAIKFTPLSNFSSENIKITTGLSKVDENEDQSSEKPSSNGQKFILDLDAQSKVEEESRKFEDEEDSDDDEDRLVIKEEEDEIEIIDLIDDDDEKPENFTPKIEKISSSSWNIINSQSMNNIDSSNLTSNNHVSISYPSTDGTSHLQPPVIQISYQFPIDSQNSSKSASSGQIQRHFSPYAQTSGQIHKNPTPQSSFGQLFGGSTSKYPQNNKNLNLQPSTSQMYTNVSSKQPQTSNKRRQSSTNAENSSKISENPPKKTKFYQESEKISIIPYIPSSKLPRRMSSTSSDGSSSTSHPFQCKMCMSIFKRKIDMIHHLKSHSEAKFECQRCGMKFKFEGYFQKHACIACELCNKTFFLKQQLRNHQRNEHDIQTEMYECDLCGKMLRYRHGVLYHMSKTHMLYLEDKFGCDVCGKRFKLKESIRLHIKNHESVIECKLCSKKVKRVNLNVHMKCVHATGRNFKCRICKTSFKTKECLKSHVRTHEKNFECTECGKRFSTKSHLKEHSEWHRNPDAYKCKICQKSFSQKYCLKAHVKLHENGHLFTKFKCTLCTYSTDKAENLEKHKLKHKRQEENEEMRKNWVKCEKCPVRLKNKLKLATHYWKKHSEVMPK